MAEKPSGVTYSPELNSEVFSLILITRLPDGGSQREIKQHEKTICFDTGYHLRYDVIRLR
jgi:hypothetical protein